MFASATADRFLAAAFSLAISAGFFAYAIIPATPTLA
ncbi:MAG: enoyl-CoA hydratase [Erythrobacter sp.]